jgi:Putative metallopeptidase
MKSLKGESVKHAITCLVSFFLITQTMIATPPQSSTSCSQPNIDAQTSSVTVAVEPSTPQVRQTVTVAAHKGLVYSLSLTQGSALVARFQVAGGLNNKIKVMLLDTTNYQLYQAHQQYSYFKGTTGEVRNTGNYVFKVPQTDVYDLVVDNAEAWLLPREVQLYVYSVSPAPTTQSIEAQQTMTNAFGFIGKLFVFPSFNIQLRHCGLVNAFSDPNITICTELVESLTDQHLEQAIGFVFFHELGHSMMRLWGLPLSDNEDVADEFATVCMILAKQKQPALQAAQWWASQTNQQEALSKLWLDDRHTVSPQRARNAIRWLNQPDDLLQRWMRLMTPHLQSNTLLELMKDTRLAPVRNVMQEELQRRGCSI